MVGGMVALSAFAAVLAGCDTGQGFAYQSVPMSCPANGNRPLTLVIGARANSPRPDLPASILTLVHDAAAGGQQIQVIRVDGRPTTALTATFATHGQNSQIRDHDLQNFVSQTEQFVAGLQPKVPQADVLSALSLAGQITPGGGTIVLMDSGIPTTGPLSYLNQNMFGASPTDVTTFLQAQGLMPDLSGRSVVLVDIGDTADPQSPLPKNLQTQVVNLWTAVANQAHATCVSLPPTAFARTSINTAVPVALVQLPPPPSFPDCGTTVLSDSGAVGFVVGTANFRDPSAAQATLGSLAQILIGHTQRVTLTGSTSSEGSADTNQTLSENRAGAVKEILVRSGVDPSRIATVGVGSHGPNHVTDMTPNGVLIPAAAAQNRSVTVTLACQN
jgi:outer membrane protein OmpA-like peptidoglycan-associated protein